MNLSKSDILEYYSRKDVLNEIVRCSLNKEVAGNYNMKGYSRRPDTINYPQEVLDMVNQGITSFHFSEETWNNVYEISSDKSKKQLDELRKGWDLILDIDSKYFEVSKVAADLIVKAIKHHDIKSVTCKFSGNNGFHIAVPYEAFPKFIHNKETRLLFPELPRHIAMYINNMIEEKLETEIITKFNLASPNKLNEFAEAIGVEVKDLIINNKLNVEKAIKIDTIFLNSRHLCRMGYSFNEKSGLVSIPIECNEILTFDKENARPENIIVRENLFLTRDNIKNDEAKSLLLQSMDFYNSNLSQASIITSNIKEINEERKYDENQFKETIKILNEAFPPCMNLALAGVNDGRKRALFVLMNFLATAGYSDDEVKKYIYEWNPKNREPLKDSYIKGQLSYLKKVKKVPFNCSNTIYKELDICKPDTLCQRIKNPIAYATKKHFFVTNQQEREEKERLKEEKKKERMLKQKEKEQKRREKLKKAKEEEQKDKDNNNNNNSEVEAQENDEIIL